MEMLAGRATVDEQDEMISSLQLLPLLAAFASAALALTVIFGQRRLANWSFAAGMLLLALESVFMGLSSSAPALEKMIYWQRLRLLVLAFLPSVWLLFSLCYARGNYREFLSIWKYFLAGAFFLPLPFAIGYLDLLIQEGGQSTSAQLALGWPGIAINLIFLVVAVLVLMNLERTFRSAVGTIRWRIKFMILGLGVLFAVRIYTSSQVLLYSAVKPGFAGLNAIGLLLACGLISCSLFRSRLSGVDLYPSHSLIFRSLTVSLAGIYLLVVGVFAKVVTFFGGDAAFPLKAFLVLVALIGMALLLLSDRIHTRARHLISRHLRRPLYDYRDVWTVFTERTTSSLDEKELSATVTKLVSETFQALSVTVWLTPEKEDQLQFGASTLLMADKALAILKSVPVEEVGNLLQRLRQQITPFDIDQSPDASFQVVKRVTPSQFPNAGSRICVPLLAGGRLLGMMTLADRVNGLQFSVEELDLLKCLADQIGANLLKIQLSKRLLEAKEMEAFQTISAFFVHDLKNTASTLSLMLQNLPAHFDDPAFRQDALRGIGKSVSRMNELIGRLSLLRQTLEMKPKEVDLNELVSAVLSETLLASEVTLVKDLHPVPKISADPEQMQKVITNLVLNARDAVGLNGQIRVGTSQKSGWVVLSVADNGCGMSADFLTRCLFRPFQTTKKKGIGIGMYHSKLIVDAHHGRIEVESREGAGSNLSVLLPCPSA